MKIRPLQPHDAEQVFNLRVATFSSVMQAEYDPDEVYIPDEHRMVAVDDGRVVGHVGVWPFRQAFKGRPVPMGGVAAVLVAEGHRGQGIGSRLIAAALDHMGEAHMVISSLYPSTPLPYRAWGWEFAGVHVRRRVATRELLDLPRPAGIIELRPYESTDLDAVVAVHDALTITEPGGLVAGEQWLRRGLQLDPDEPEFALVATRDGQVVGLVSVAKTVATDEHSAYGLDVLRLCGVDRHVERALWRALGHHHSVAAMTTFRSRPAEPLLLDLPHGLYLPAPLSDHFMTRLVDARAAIAARGWPPVLATIELDIVDARRPTNSGPFVLEVADRAATLTPGGSGRVSVDIATFSSLYTGFASAWQLVHADRLRGATDDDVRALADVFCAPAPFLRDYF